MKKYFNKSENLDKNMDIIVEGKESKNDIKLEIKNNIIKMIKKITN